MRMRQYAGALSGLLLGACANTVVPPQTPDNPVPVFLLDHGRHASLVLARDYGITRYSYGHWDYYARNRTGALRASGTLFGDDQAGLGRRQLPGPADLRNVRRRVLVPIQHAWRIEVPAARAATLSRRLDGIFRANLASRLDNPLYDLEFVHHPEPYGVDHNSNHVTGEWLRALGCEVDMGGPFSIWTIVPRDAR
ncbi:MAG: hypothetical protein R3225_09680 [Halofilum sp. (in: g-proteobacteria)]|nr:hypothetical protein [Halofilum sp. (in: g-proteobacteria)]